MSPQECEKSYHGDKEQRETKAGEGCRDEEPIGKGNYELMQGDKMGTSSNPSDLEHKSPSFEEASNPHVSPAPVVEKGGENEFVKVSHLASVQVKAVPTLSILKTKTEPKIIKRRILPRRSEDAVSLSSRRKVGNQKRYIGDDDDDDNFPYGDETLHNEDTSVGNLVVIEKSPYEPGGCAENRESLFEEIKVLLLENDETSQIAQMFGPTNAGCLVKASALVEKSGMVYSRTWTEGSIRGDPVGIIPSHLLLMVLVPNRFVKANELLLSGLCRDLAVYNSVNCGLDDWGWTDDYELVRATKKNYKFKTNRRDCFKCAVFVARAHSCFLAFGKKELKPRLISKLRACLNMMETHLIDPSSNGHNAHATSNGASASSSTSTNTSSTIVKKRKKVVPEHVLSTSSLMHASSGPCTTASTTANAKNSNGHQDPSVKKKRGRPSKNSKHPPLQQRSSSIILSPTSQQPKSEDNDYKDEEKEYLSPPLKRHNLQSNSLRGGSRVDNVASSLTQRGISSSPSVPSLHHLMSRFEDQYKEMGKRYAEMGTILTYMKTAIEERREQSEQEIRRELLDEIQRNILESMPKR